MPYLIDGNNLLFALRRALPDCGRGTLCQLLAALAKEGERIHVVFDGHSPPGPLARQIATDFVEVTYSERDSADTIIVELIRTNSAPRLLTVVSTDHVIRLSARRRRCRTIRSEEFADLLVALRDEPVAVRPAEAGQKFKGLSEDESRQWMHEFHLDEEEK